MPKKHLLAVLTPLLGLFLAGCGGDRPATIAVSGTVTVNDGPVPGAGTLFFTPVEPAEGYERRPGRADFDEQGRYAATTFEEGDGLIPGRYLVGVHCWETPPNMDGKPVKSHLPKKYNSAEDSGLEITVDSSEGSVTRHFDLKTP
ncbi:MAG: hypothetical protein N2C14_27140 [Planctomycetales bacterium]